MNLGMKLEWLEDGVKAVMVPTPAIRYDNLRNRKIWLNSLVGVYIAWKDGRNDPEKAVIYGNGELLPGNTVSDCMRILDEESVAIPWQKGDILLIDNFAVLHARNSFDLPRRVLVSLCK